MATRSLLLDRARWALTVTACLAAASTAAVGLAAPASAAAGTGTFLASIESARGAAGLAPYSTAGDLAAVAQGWANELAARGSLAHNPALASQVSGWQAVGENVGMGPDAAAIADAFLHSAPHRANILDGDFTQVGIATAVDSRGTLYVVEDFRQPVGHQLTPHVRTSPAASHRAPAARTTTAAAPRHTAVPSRGTATAATPVRLRPVAAQGDPLTHAISFAQTLAELPSAANQPRS